MRPFILIVSILAILFAACDNRKDYWGEIDFLEGFQITDADGVLISQISGQYSDTVKQNLPKQYLYDFPNSEESVIAFEYDNNLCKVEIDTVQKNILVTAIASGIIELKVIVTDPFNRSSNIYLNLLSNYNLRPVANAEIIQISDKDLYEIEIDASGSYDEDAYFDGKIVGYEYEIVDVCKDYTTLDKYKRILSEPGLYTIKVRVLDNNEDWSPISTYSFEVKN